MQSLQALSWNTTSSRIEAQHSGGGRKPIFSKSRMWMLCCITFSMSACEARFTRNLAWLPSRAKNSNVILSMPMQLCKRSFKAHSDSPNSASWNSGSACCLRAKQTSLMSSHKRCAHTSPTLVLQLGTCSAFSTSRSELRKLMSAVSTEPHACSSFTMSCAPSLAPRQQNKSSSATRNSSCSGRQPKGCSARFSCSCKRWVCSVSKRFSARLHCSTTIASTTGCLSARPRAKAGWWGSRSFRMICKSRASRSRICKVAPGWHSSSFVMVEREKSCIPLASWTRDARFMSKVKKSPSFPA
mmetsp:Transcript_120672/g.301063  ORF Transcript_120672/g.301063 Transcript_120672/m.301063 type:complete len:299 (-) Transcript_120672:976-1872(-)